MGLSGRSHHHSFLVDSHSSAVALSAWVAVGHLLAKELGCQAACQVSFRFHSLALGRDPHPEAHKTHLSVQPQTTIVVAEPDALREMRELAAVAVLGWQC